MIRAAATLLPLLLMLVVIGLGIALSRARFQAAHQRRRADDALADLAETHDALLDLQNNPLTDSGTAQMLEIEIHKLKEVHDADTPARRRSSSRGTAPRRLF